MIIARAILFVLTLYLKFYLILAIVLVFNLILIMCRNIKLIMALVGLVISLVLEALATSFPIGILSCVYTSYL